VSGATVLRGGKERGVLIFDLARWCNWNGGRYYQHLPVAQNDKTVRKEQGFNTLTTKGVVLIGETVQAGRKSWVWQKQQEGEQKTFMLRTSSERQLRKNVLNYGTFSQNGFPLFKSAKKNRQFFVAGNASTGKKKDKVY